MNLVSDLDRPASGCAALARLLTRTAATHHGPGANPAGPDPGSSAMRPNRGRAPDVS